MARSSGVKKIEKRLAYYYYNPAHPASFSSVGKLARAANVSLKVAKEWLMKQDVYTTHFPARKNAQSTGFYNSYYPNATWEVDLSDMSSLQRWNDSHTFMLCVIDVFSRQGQARALKSKRSEEVARAMQDIFKESGVVPEVVQSDQGSEFLGEAFQNLMKKNKILFRIARNQHKASIVERVQRTWKSRMWKYFTHKETYRWIDVLPKLIRAYNNSPHSALNGIPPNKVDEDNAYEIWESNYLRHIKSRKKFSSPRFQPGDFVRVSKYKRTFEKGYTQSFSVEVYKVDQVFFYQGLYMYQLRSITDEVVEGYFYPHELQRVYYTPDSKFKIENVLRRRVGVDGGEESFVKWKGWHPSHNSWIPTSWIEKL